MKRNQSDLTCQKSHDVISPFTALTPDTGQSSQALSSRTAFRTILIERINKLQDWDLCCVLNSILAF